MLQHCFQMKKGGNVTVAQLGLQVTENWLFHSLLVTSGTPLQPNPLNVRKYYT